MARNVVVVGAGQAGCSLVSKLRADGFDGAVTLIGVLAMGSSAREPSRSAGTA